MGLFGTRIKDKDLLKIVVALKSAQEQRDTVDNHPRVQAEGYSTGGSRKDTYSAEVDSVLHGINTELAGKLEKAAAKLRSGGYTTKGKY